MNRKSRPELIRETIRQIAPHARIYTHYVSGPAACYGKKGEVSITMYTNMWDEQKQAAADLIEVLVPGVVRAYVTREVKSPIRRGGNLKVVFDTRANGEPA